MENNDEKLSAIDKSEGRFLQELKKALLDNCNITHINKQDDEILLRFLRFADYDVEEALSCIQRSDNMLRLQDDLLRISNPEEMTPLYDLGQKAVIVFKKRDPEGRLVLLFKVRYWDPDEFDSDKAIIAMSHGLDELMFNVENQRKGFIGIFDLTGISHKKAIYIASKVTRENIMLGIKSFQYAYPVKIVAAYTVNVPLFGAVIYNAVKYFIPKDLRDKVYVNYSGPKVLHKYFSKDFLPESVLGNIPDDVCQDNEFFDILRRKKDRLVNFQL